MSIGSAIRQIVIGDGNVSSIIDDKMFPMHVPQDVERPAVIYRLITALRDPRNTAGLVQAELNLECQVDSNGEYLLVKELGDSVRKALDNFSGEVDDIFIRGCFLDDERDDYRQPSDGSDVGVMKVIQNWEVWYKEIVPRECN